ncbi:hypothetical protein B0H11DRAFT_582442 [Mycena galericulata]|nr:hypothetical protein B0H11DRAFT_582442 [Mycena galericulata]
MLYSRAQRERSAESLGMWRGQSVIATSRILDAVACLRSQAPWTRARWHKAEKHQRDRAGAGRPSQRKREREDEEKDEGTDKEGIAGADACLGYFLIPIDSCPLTLSLPTWTTPYRHLETSQKILTRSSNISRRRVCTECKSFIKAEKTFIEKFPLVGILYHPLTFLSVLGLSSDIFAATLGNIGVEAVEGLDDIIPDNVAIGADERLQRHG